MKSTVTRKVIRSILLRFPALLDVKYDLLETYYATTKTVYLKNLEGLRHFDLADKLIVDVGANRGQCIRAFKNMQPAARITAFEPVPFLSETLARRFADDPSMCIESCALSDEPGIVDIHVPFYDGFMFDGMASIDAGDIAGAMNTNRFFRFDETKLTTSTYSVPCRTLDAYHLAPSVMKLHAQRHEIQIIKGATDTIRLHRPIIMSAWAWKEEIDLIQDFGYAEYTYDNGRFALFDRGVKNDEVEFTWFLLPEHTELIA
jgi:FkbM family methyltransferase